MKKNTIIAEIKEKLLLEIANATAKDWIKFGFTIVIGLAILSWGLNQFMALLYSIDIATDPCGLCMKLNNVEIINKGIKINWSNITVVNYSFGLR